MLDRVAHYLSKRAFLLAIFSRIWFLLVVLGMFVSMSVSSVLFSSNRELLTNVGLSSRLLEEESRSGAQKMSTSRSNTMGCATTDDIACSCSITCRRSFGVDKMISPLTHSSAAKRSHHCCRLADSWRVSIGTQVLLHQSI